MKSWREELEVNHVSRFGSGRDIREVLSSWVGLAIGWVEMDKMVWVSVWVDFGWVNMG